MAQSQDTDKLSGYQSILLDDPDFLQDIVTTVLQQTLDDRFTQHIGASIHERTDGRKGYRNGSYSRTVKTRVGRIQLSVPRDRNGTFQSDLFARYQRNEKALVLSLMEMTLEGVSTRKVSKVTEVLCGTSFSKSLVSSLSADLDSQLDNWRNRSLDEAYPYLFVDALYEKVRHNGRVVSMAVMIVVGVSETGHRSILAVDVAHSENEADWGSLFSHLTARGLRGVQLVVSDNHKGLRKAIDRHFQGSSWQRCQVHFMRNLLTRLRKRDRVWVMSALKDVFNAPDRDQAWFRLRYLADQLRDDYPDLSDWLEEDGQDVLAVFDFPADHRRRLRTTNSVERLNEEIRRRTRVIRIFPNRDSCLRMASALCQEHDDDWTTGKCYLDMSLLSKNIETDVGKQVLVSAV